MSDRIRVPEILEELQVRKSNLTCKEVKSLLDKLGFEVRDSKRGGHKVYTHDSLEDFCSASFNCGHGKNPEIKPVYITKIIRIIEDNEKELESWIEALK